jgi:PBP1b-binding outer membrane lipoprotein LpoB
MKKIMFMIIMMSFVLVGCYEDDIKEANKRNEESYNLSLMCTAYEMSCIRECDKLEDNSEYSRCASKCYCGF